MSAERSIGRMPYSTLPRVRGPSGPDPTLEARASAPSAVGAEGRLADHYYLGELDAEHWVSRWEREGTRTIERLAAQFWDEGERWIAERRRAR